MKNSKKDKLNQLTIILEAFVLRKIKIEDIYFFPKNHNESDYNSDKQFYICLNDDEIIREAIISKKQNSNLNISKILNSKPLLFKVGPINDSIPEKKENYLITHYALLTNIKVGNFQTYFDTEDPEKDIDRTQINLSEKECLFIHRKPNDDFNTDENILNKKLNYWFITNNDTSIKPECLISYKFENINDYVCSNCNNHSPDMKFCLNDNLYFCAKCDDDIHNNSKLGFNALKKHKRISNLNSSIMHNNICEIENHDKPYEIYCTSCEELFCIKCLGTEIHNFNHDNGNKSIVHINDKLIQRVGLEQSKMNEDLMKVTSKINNKITELVENYYNNIHKEIIDRKNKAVDDISKENLKRTTFLMCNMMELQRLLWEIDSKINFIKIQSAKNDFPNFLLMIKIFDDYIKNDFLKNLKLILDRNLEGLSVGINKIEYKKK